MFVCWETALTNSDSCWHRGLNQLSFVSETLSFLFTRDFKTLSEQTFLRSEIHTHTCRENLQPSSFSVSSSFNDRILSDHSTFFYTCTHTHTRHDWHRCDHKASLNKIGHLIHPLCCQLCLRAVDTLCVCVCVFVCTYASCKLFILHLRISYEACFSNMYVLMNFIWENTTLCNKLKNLSLCLPEYLECVYVFVCECVMYSPSVLLSVSLRGSDACLSAVRNTHAHARLCTCTHTHTHTAHTQTK